MIDLQSSRYRTDVQNKPIQTKDLIPVVNDLEKLSKAIPDNIVEAPFTPNDNPIVAGDTYQEAFEKTQGQINGIDTEITTINGEITQLQNNEYKITYYEVVSGAGGSLTVPTGATINEGEFGSSGNCILSKINVDNKPTFESPKTAGGVIVTASLDPLTGIWAASGVYTDPSVALIYSLKINALNYPNLDYDFIIQSEEIDDKTTFVAPLVKDVSKDEVSIPPATTTDDGYLTSTDWNTFNSKQAALGFTPENVANKSTDVSTDQASNTKYPSVKAVYDYLNSFPKIILKSITDVSHTGDTNVTQVYSELITGATFSVSNFLNLYAQFRKVGTAGNLAVRFYVNTSNSLGGATQIAQFNSGVAANLYYGVARMGLIKSATNTEIYSATASIISSIVNSSTAVSSLNIDWTVNQYFLISIQLTNATDTGTLSGLFLERK